MHSRYDIIRRNTLKARTLIVKATAAAGSGHPGGSFSMAEILGCLFYKHMRYDAANPCWEGRDRLVLSKGHAAPGLFSHLAISGFIPESEVETLRSLGSRLQGHPDMKCPGVEFCGGSLGTGLSYSVGMALSARMDGLDSRIYTVIGDGESDEGQIWEATMAAAKFKLDNLTVILDRNYVQQDSYTEGVMPLDAAATGPNPNPVAARNDPTLWRTSDKWRAFGWHVIEVDGHRIEQIDSAIRGAKQVSGRPSIIIARTVKGKGVRHMEDNPQWHGKAPSPEMVPIILDELKSQAAVAPSIIAGDMTRLDLEVKRCDGAGPDYIHMDVMDGIFVPTVTFGYEKIRELRPLTDIPFDSHLMISQPARHVKKYAEAGSDIITVHAEVCSVSEFGEIHDYLKGVDVGVGVAVNPQTPIPPWLKEFVPTLDQFIVMSVVPGRSGQKYIYESHQKTRTIIQSLNEHGFGGVVEADGGVNILNVADCFDDGARVFVGGSSMVGQPDMKQAIDDIRGRISYARQRMLLHRAHSLGGSKLVHDWIALHVVGEQSDTLNKIARESSLL
ncbi:MAG: ribulose-phosphate 3-epimerase [Cenarchaeum sp. SB0678_bin_8]|nr:ribulose-phosphate 3-epimerase [Cenarchaeum sp. SB0678_bin_8]